MKKLLMMGFVLISANNLFAAWGWSSGTFTTSRYVASTIGGQPAICLYLSDANGTQTKYFIWNPESTVSKALLSEIIAAKTMIQSHKIFYDGSPVEGDWFQLGAVKL